MIRSDRVPNLSFVHNWPRVADSARVLPLSHCGNGAGQRARDEVLSWLRGRAHRMISRRCPTRPT